MPKLKRQDVFNKVWQHAVVEGNEPSYDPHISNCAYRSKDGGKCFVGVCIPDALYNEAMEETCAAGLTENYPEIASLFDKRSASPAFLNKLQYVHDVCGGLEQEDGGWSKIWRDRLSVFAKKWNLTIPNAEATTAQG